MEVEVARGQQLYRQIFERGQPKSKLETLGSAPNRRGTSVRFKPDPQIFGAEGRLQAAAAVQDGALEGLSVRRRRDPLALRQGAAARRRGRAGEGDVPLCRRPQGFSHRRHSRRHAGASRHFPRQSRGGSARTARSNGRWRGPRTPTALFRPTAIPCRRRTAAPTKRGCAPRSRAASRTTPNASARASARPRSPATT